MPSKMSKTKLKMRMTRRTSAKQESSPQPPAKAIKTSLEGNHYQSHHQQQQQQRQPSAEDSASSDTHSKISNAPSVKSNASYKSGSNFPMSHNKNKPQQRDEWKIQSVANSKAPPPHPDDKSSQSSASSDEKHCELDGPIYKRYTIRTRLGKGAYGIVWEAYEKSTGNKVALKKIFDAFRNDTDAQRTYREIMFLREFGNHPNIIRLLNVHRAVNNMDIYLVFPFMEHDLHRVIKESPQMLKDNHIRMIFYQTLKAVKYLHSGDVIHRDLKPANILLDDYLNVKVADFGLARSLSSPEDVMSEANPVMTDYVATRWYRPPEILLSCPFYTKGVDMWSLGCILGEMILKVPLFPGGSTVHQVETIMAHIAPPTPAEIEEMCGQNTQSTLIESAMTYRKRSLSEIFELCDDDTIDLLQKFLVFNPAKRITAEETLSHPYLSRYRRLSEEMTMSHPVCPPLNDYIQLPMCQYRSVIYDLIQVRKSRQQTPSHPFFISPQQQGRQDPESPIPTPLSKSNSHQGNVTSSNPNNLTSNPNNMTSNPNNMTSNPNNMNSNPNNMNSNPNNMSSNPNMSSNQDTRRVRSLNSDCNKMYNNNKSKRENDRDFRKCYSVKTVQINEKVGSSDLSPRPTTAGQTVVETEGRKLSWQEASKSNNTRKNNSTSNIPQVRKVPGPDGDGHDLPLPYLKIVSTAPGLQGKNPRLFDRSDLSARNNHPVPSDLRGADKRLYEIYSHTEDLEEEIKAIEYQVRVKRVPAQAQWIQDLSTNLTNKASVSDPTPSNSSTTTDLAAGKCICDTLVSSFYQLHCETFSNSSRQVKSCGASTGNFKGLARVVGQTKLPEILQSWNQTCSSKSLEPSKQRRSTYFQDPPKAMGQRLQRMVVSPKEGQLQGQRQGYQQQYSRCTTPIEATQQQQQVKSKHYESYSQTHGTISASDLTDLKANIGLGK